MDKPVIVEATNSAEFAAGRMLIEEYAAALGVDLCFQNFSDELANIANIYGPPRGCLLLAREDYEYLGCVAFRYQGPNICEMKRLYVRPMQRGMGLGRRLVESIIQSARHLGYSRIVLDTLLNMIEAQSLYHSLGFREVAEYYPNPLNGVRYLALDFDAR